MYHAILSSCAMVYFILVLVTLVTSFISGVLSMAGSMILMGVFGFFLTVPASMVLHGIAQGGHQHRGVGQIALLGGCLALQLDVPGTTTLSLAEQGVKHGITVQPGHASPVDATTAMHQRGDLAVADDAGLQFLAHATSTGTVRSAGKGGAAQLSQ